MLNNGTGAHAPLDPYTTDSNNRLNQITFDWDNGFYGFVPVGARRSQSGRSWYDPYTQTEGSLRNDLLPFSFGAGFGLTDGQQGGKSTLTATGQSLVTDDAGRSCKQSEITPVFLWNKPTGIPLVETPHTFIQIPNRMTIGFYAAISVEHFAAVPGLFSLPATGGGAIASSITANVGLIGTGEVRDNISLVSSRKYLRSKPYKACPETVAALEKSINDNRLGVYSLTNIGGLNCSGWALKRLQDAGFKTSAFWWQPFLAPIDLVDPERKTVSSWGNIRLK